MTTTPTLDDDFEVALDSLNFDDLDDPDTPVETLVASTTPEDPAPDADPEPVAPPAVTTPARFQLAPTQEGNLELASDVASANLLMAQQELARRFSENPLSFTLKNLIEVGEHSYKVSGMAKKQEQKENAGAGAGFSIVINLPSGQTATLGNPNTTVINQDSAETLADNATALLQSCNGKTLS